MISIGVDQTTARAIAAGAGKTGGDADKFAKDNRALVTLTPEQQQALFLKIVPHYESLVRRKVTVPLLQHEFDALVSFAYNPGHSLDTVATHINQGRVVDAMNTIKTVVGSGKTKLKGLVVRRDREVNMYLTGQR